MTGYVDLHTHTTYSDGTLSPEDLVKHARAEGLSAIAICDHDTVAGVREGMDQGKVQGIEVIPGVELSIEFPLPSGGHMHILGLFIDPESPGLLHGLDWLRQNREARTPKVLKILNENDVHITEEDVKQEAGDGSVGRPHIARVLMNKRYVTSIQEAFDRYLKKGAVAYVPKEKFPIEKGISMIREADGIPILSHPVHLGLDVEELASLIPKLKEHGLMGIEAYYPDHTPDNTALFLSLAKEHDLLVSGGTDFHGENKPKISIGVGFGNMDIPYTLVERMKEVISK